MRLPGAEVTFTTRRGGVSTGPYESLNLGILTDDDPENVTENRRRAAAEAAVEPERVAMGWQVHGTDLLDWDAPPPDPVYAAPGGKDLPQADGHLTREPGIGLLVLVADCYPVALSDGEQAAMLHCGWRPLAGGILESALDALRRAFRRRPWAPGSAAAATRWATRCSRRSRASRERPRGGCSTCAA